MIMTTNFSLDKLDDVGSGVNLTEVPPINQKRMLAFINEFLINTISLLNDFYQNCESKLQKFDSKLQKLEAELCILESKLKSIPGLEVDLPQHAVTVELPQPQTENDSPKDNLESVVPVACNDRLQVNNAEDESEIVETSKTSNPDLEKYYKMLRFGVPLDAVKVEMQIDGRDPNLLDNS